MRSKLVLAILTAILLVVPLATGATAQDQKVLSFGMSSDISSFDPAIAYDVLSSPIVHSLFDTLVTYDEGTNLVPGIAATMPAISPDGLTYTFDLRPGVSFVRKGEILRPVTADDVAYSINRLLRPDLTPTPSPVGPSFFSIIEGADAVLAGTADAASGIRVVDADTVEFTLTHPDRAFLNLLAMSFGSIVPREVAGLDSTAFAADLVGSGPFYLDSYVPGQGATLRRNPHYWRAGYPLVDEVDLRVNVSPQNQFLGAQSNQLDLMGDPLAAADRITAESDPSIGDRLVSSTITATSWINMDTSGPDSPFSDPLVRQAVNYAIDKDNLLRIAGGRGEIIDCIFPPTLPGFDADCHPYPHSVETAKALMAQAGNTGFTTTLYGDDSERSRLSAESIKADLAAIGITVDIVLNDFGTFLGIVSKPHAAPMALGGWSQDFPDPSDFLDPMFTCSTAVEGGQNLSAYCDPAVDARLTAARGVTDIAVAIPEYQAIQRTIMDAAPIVPVLAPIQDGVISDRVTGFDHYHPVWGWDFATIGLK